MSWFVDVNSCCLIRYHEFWTTNREPISLSITLSEGYSACHAWMEMRRRNRVLQDARRMNSTLTRVKEVIVMAAFALEWCSHRESCLFQLPSTYDWYHISASKLLHEWWNHTASYNEIDLSRKNKRKMIFHVAQKSRNGIFLIWRDFTKASKLILSSRAFRFILKKLTHNFGYW